MFKIFATLAVVMGVALPASAQTIERIQETGELKLGFRKDAVPLSYIDNEGKAAGYTPMVCAAVAQGIVNAYKMENLTVSFVPVETQNQFDMVASGKVDLLCGAATITMRRREIVDFSIPVYVDGASLLVAKDNIVSLSDANGIKVGVRAGTTTEEATKNTLAAENIDAEMISFENHVAGVEALKRSEIDAYIADQSILFGLLTSGNLSETYVISDDILTLEKQGLAMARGDTEFNHLVDSILSELFASGVIQKMFGTTFPGSEPGLAMRAMFLISPTLP